MADAVVLAPLAVGCALVAAGAAKVRDPGAPTTALADLGVPDVLRRLLRRPRWLPWLEVVLGLALLLPGPGFLVTAVLVAVLLAAYTVLVVRVVATGREAECDCFGGLGGGHVGAMTVVRNQLLLAAAVLAVVDAVRGHSLVGRLGALDAGDVGWLVAVVLVGVLVAATVHRDAGGAARAGIPFLHVQGADGTAVSLPELASERPQLLVTLSTSCSSCAKVTDAIGDWPARLPGVDVHVLSALPAGEPTPPGWPAVLHDPQERVSAVLGLVRPSAVLLGADALVAGGPVHGASAVIGFADEIEAQLRRR
ncbi:hypothetical protein D9V37_15950 [Nocardioides mangrovicus]|uniref:Methylamine utilisation protein MauE domain-containing protein n=1 Tax=Nocardioides mangrovicus TaxID=2478913 RepID=A0A3L8NYL1_9ACTN|nr:MauE/DoxX family redox-associated membrane protein [Nocardioides mangrovicus]RLV47653.1 hypothetical protein D9V37_15950 [Nocardioides mangrovicus]